MLQQVTNGWAEKKVRLANRNETKAGVGGWVDTQPLEPQACCIIITWLKNRPSKGTRPWGTVLAQGSLLGGKAESPFSLVLVSKDLISVAVPKLGFLCPSKSNKNFRDKIWRKQEGGFNSQPAKRGTQ